MIPFKLHRNITLCDFNLPKCFGVDFSNLIILIYPAAYARLNAIKFNDSEAKIGANKNKVPRRV